MIKPTIIDVNQLLFTYDVCDDRVNCKVTLDDYDWMCYTFETIFKTAALGILNVKIEYFGASKCQMDVIQWLDDVEYAWEIEFDHAIFQKHCTTYLNAFSSQWGQEYAFSAGSYIIDFYNDVITNHDMCNLVSQKPLSEQDNIRYHKIMERCLNQN